MNIENDFYAYFSRRPEHERDVAAVSGGYGSFHQHIYDSAEALDGAFIIADLFNQRRIYKLIGHHDGRFLKFGYNNVASSIFHRSVALYMLGNSGVAVAMMLNWGKGEEHIKLDCQDFSPRILSDGTCKVSDVMRKVAVYLDSIDCVGRYESLTDDAYECCNCDKCDPEVASSIMQELEEAINAYLPHGYSYGVHPDDPACIGIWEDE